MLSEEKLTEIEQTQSMSLSDMKDVAPTIRRLQGALKKVRSTCMVTSEDVEYLLNECRVIAEEVLNNG